MEFAEAINLVKSKIADTEGKDYDGVIVKILEASNTLDPNRGATKQTHIAITGEQVDIFPYLNAHGYFEPEYDSKDDSLKSFFLLQIPVRLYRKNVENLYRKDNPYPNIFKDSESPYLDVNVSVQGSRRKDQSDQIQFSLKKYDQNEYVNFRELLKVGDTIVLLKYRGEFKYDLFGLKKESEEAEALKELNNKFYKEKNSVTKVSPQLFVHINENKTTASEDLNEEQLSEILKNMYNAANEQSGFKVCSIHSFGIIFANEITTKITINKHIYRDLVLKAGIPESYSAEVLKGTKLRESFEKNIFGISLNNDNEIVPKDIAEENSRVTGGKNILLYGVPGAGKSFYINKNFCSDQNLIERVVFHPEYTYSDFVGQILPQIDGDKLKYIFTPGPFTTILKKAVYSPKQEFYLIIEELNRGNAPAIFGEIFQLLDRTAKGESEYSITNFDIAKEIFKDKNHKIRIPSNLWILATMNTSDQNVFTLDTAFQRRWEMNHIKNDIAESDFAKAPIANSEITWGTFALKVNSLIVKGNEGTSSFEDKRLGAYFATETELRDKKLFAEKVLKYLWDDAFKLDRALFFKEDLSSFDEVLNRIDSASDLIKAVVREDIFSSMTVTADKNNSSVTNNTNEPQQP